MAPAFKSIARVLTEKAVIEEVKKLEGSCLLDLGSKDAPYRSIVDACIFCYRVDIRPGPEVTLLADMHTLPLKAGSVDSILATEVLEHLANPILAIEEMHRVIKPGGRCILTTRFFHPYHPDPGDFYRFTSEGLRYLFRHFSHVEIQPLGNRLHTISLCMFQWKRGVLGHIGALIGSLLLRVWPTGNENWAPGFMVVARKAEEEG